jgi:hypothetical protein
LASFKFNKTGLGLDFSNLKNIVQSADTTGQQQ